MSTVLNIPYSRAQVCAFIVLLLEVLSHFATDFIAADFYCIMNYVNNKLINMQTHDHTYNNHQEILDSNIAYLLPSENK